MAESASRGEVVGDASPHGVRLPGRALGAVVLGLVVVSIVTFPAVVAARERPADPLRVAPAILTADGTDHYEFRSRPDRVVVAAPVTNRSWNLRTVFWDRRAVPVADQVSCATWEPTRDTLVQQGAALRVAMAANGRVRALTVTKNIYFGGGWNFNVHVWDSWRGLGPLIRAIDVRDALTYPTRPPVVRPLPWRMCARTVGHRLVFRVWALGTPEPPWGDPTHGATMPIPPGTPARGVPGWYAGHLRPGTTVEFTHLDPGPADPWALPRTIGASVLGTGVGRRPAR